MISGTLYLVRHDCGSLSVGLSKAAVIVVLCRRAFEGVRRGGGRIFKPIIEVDLSLARKCRDLRLMPLARLHF